MAALGIALENTTGISFDTTYRITPLLAEYFYEDWSKVAAVLGDCDGHRFLAKEELRAPDDLDVDGDAPSSWRSSVRAQFSPDAYAFLSRIASDNCLK